MQTVLTVDRSRVVRAVIERHLERFDCLPIEATTADEAIVAAREHAPALMLVDAAAHSAATRAADAAYAAAPVVLLMTNHPGAERHADDPHVIARLRKPFDQSSFDRAVRSVLGTPRAGARSPRPAPTPTDVAAMGAAR
jgi:CheY-like chemotaxis protein